MACCTEYMAPSHHLGLSGQPPPWLFWLATQAGLSAAWKEGGLFSTLFISAYERWLTWMRT